MPLFDAKKFWLTFKVNVQGRLSIADYMWGYDVWRHPEEVQKCPLGGMDISHISIQGLNQFFGFFSPWVIGESISIRKIIIPHLWSDLITIPYRYVKMFSTYTHGKRMPLHVLKVISACTWLAAIAISAPPLFGWSSYVIMDGYHCSSNFQQSIENSSYIMFCVIVGFLGPFVLCLVTNIKFLLKVKELNKSFPVKKSISVFILGSMTAFTVAWLPLVIYGVLSMFGVVIAFPFSIEKCSYITKITIITDTLLFLLLNKKFRKCASFRRTISSKKKQRSIINQ